MIKVALAKFGHDKENQKDPNDFSFSHKQLRWLCSTKQKWKKKEKEPTPGIRGHDKPFWKEIPKTKRLGNKHK